jgi:hypothetical protein
MSYRCFGNDVVLASREEKDDRQESDTEYLVAHLHCARNRAAHAACGQTAAR